MGTPANQSKPEPLYHVVSRPKCPVCGQSVYSSAGIHPQCAQTQADQKRLVSIKAKASQLKEAADASEDTLSSWHKRCPKCREKCHVRKGTCTCGYKFPSKPKG